ncbi:Valyl-tRNA synthetase [Triticum urartu]|uniref:valine--tRNA ligase n=1 Tax=Triticum urartu TaxID=4572 RepID=M8A2C3_TRIUA|nr:Valyl-tRNA synthetase [Triticum urartu]
MAWQRRHPRGGPVSSGSAVATTFASASARSLGGSQGADADCGLHRRHLEDGACAGLVVRGWQPVAPAPAPEKAAPDDKQLDGKELEPKLKKGQKLKKDQKAQAASDGPKKTEKKQRKKAVDDENPEDFVDPDTPIGQKKSMATLMAKPYSPSVVEKWWYAWWESSGYFGADPASTKPPFVIDAMIRWRRMSGYNALWVPGVDHAGIATQVVVEKKLMRERKLTRHDIGRDKFISEYGGTILNQLRSLGASLDWSREVNFLFSLVMKKNENNVLSIVLTPNNVNFVCRCFTMDEKRSKAVTEAFVRLYKDDLIYRDYRLVNWDCALLTAISDIEVGLKEETMLKVPGYSTPVQFGVLISFAYPLEGGLGEIIVATTRIETMLSDTAITVQPEDKRYKHLHGRYAIHPFNGRKLKIICDAVLVDPTFGTGAVKITPAHDPNDFEVGKRHNLEFINIFTDDGKINSNGGTQFEGMPRFAAQVAVIEALKAKSLYKDTKKNEMSLGICSRSNDVVEPMMKPQWFVNCNTMAKAGLNAVRSKKIEIIPQQYEQDWYRWLENIRDWCVSRQLWWGHRVPAWYVTLEEDQVTDLGSNNERWIDARNESDANLETKQKYPGKKFQLNQDPDVLDTWFSSGLFPLTVLGWPDDTADLRAFYPGSVLETGLDILFFWVARMVMMGMQLGGDVPFEKSDKINLDIKRVVGYRQWCNKLWNAIRFAMGKLGGQCTPPATVAVSQMPPICKWILSVLNKAIGKTAIKPYFFNDSQEFESTRAACRDALWICLDTGLRLLHPFMPYVTEELWQRLPQPKDSCRKGSIMLSEYPSVVKLLAESDQTPPDCTTTVVNKDLSVYLQLQGALNAEAEREKLKKKRDEIQKLRHALSQKMDASGYREKAPQGVQEEDMRKLSALLERSSVKLKRS